MRTWLTARIPQETRNTLRPYLYELERRLVHLRRLSPQYGGGPDFLVIGAQKAGTTTLYDLLIQHPQIVQARTKEIAYFDRYWQNGHAWYACNFRRLVPAGGLVTGEATPDYLYSDRAPGRLHASPFKVRKFIVLLRNPVDRALSHYFHSLRLGSEKLDIKAAFAAEDARLSTFADKRLGSRYSMLSYRHSYSYVDRGRYARQLKLWFSLFDRSDFFIETSESFFRDPADVCGRLFEFLGLDPFVPETVTVRNVGSYTRGVPESFRERLAEKFVPHNEELEALLGQSLDWTR